MKTIVVTAYHGWVFRNLLGSTALSQVHERTGARVIVCVPPDKAEFTQATYGKEWMTVVSFDADAIISTRYNKFWYRLGFLIENTQYVRDQRLERRERQGTIVARINFWIVNNLASILSRIRFAVHLYRAFDYLASSKSSTEVIMRRYRPDLVLLGDIFGEHDVLFQRNAKRNHIRTIGMVRSWDNTTTKGILRMIPDRILANSETVKRELQVIHRVQSSLISVVGLPQFDAWISGPTVSRDEFFTSISSNADKRLILFAPAGDILSTTDWQVCQLLKEAINGGRLPDDIVFLIRNHPQHPADFSHFIADDHFIIENPGTRTLERNFKGATLNPFENDHLRNSIYYSELVMYVATSIGLDATVYDKPQIIVSFDGWEARQYIQSVQRYNQEDCLRSMVKSGGTKVARTSDELIAYIDMYLEKPEMDAGGRRRAVDDHLFKLDGHAANRIAEIISSKH